MPNYSFSSDTAALMGWIRRRTDSLKRARIPHESLWRDIRKYYEPLLGKALFGSGSASERAAMRDDEKILNTLPRILLHRMVAGLQSGITNQARQWCRLVVRDKKLAEQSAVRKAQDEITTCLFDAMSRSNVYDSLDAIYMHLGEFGTALGIVSPAGDDGIHVDVYDTGSFWIAENRSGRVDTALVRLDGMTVWKIVENFGEGWVPDKIKEQHDRGDLESEWEVWRLVCPTNLEKCKDIADDIPFMSIYFINGCSEKNDGILAIRPYTYNPILAPRWLCLGSVYGVGPGCIGLGDAKQLQLMERDKLEMTELAVHPPLIAPADMKQDVIDIGPGGITYENITLGGGQGLRTLHQRPPDKMALLQDIAEGEKRLRQIFYSDLFAMLINANMQASRKQMTATEVNELASEKVSLLGPILTRLNHDLLQPLVDAVFSVLAESGSLPPVPPVMEGKDLKVEYVSSIHIEQAATQRLGSLYRLLEIASSIVSLDPQSIHKLDCDEILDIVAKSVVENGVIRDDEDVAAIRQSLAQQRQAEQQAIQAQQAPGLARAARDLAATPVGDGGSTALDAIIGGAA